MSKEFNVREVGKCLYCDDPIYFHQEMTVIKGKKYHKGCYSIKLTEESELPAT